jgi:hypothetical protein
MTVDDGRALKLASQVQNGNVVMEAPMSTAKFFSAICG